MRGCSVLLVAGAGDAPWLAELGALADAAGIDGHTVDVVASTSAALERLAEESYDVVAVSGAAGFEEGGLERLVEIAGGSPRRSRVLVEDPSGDERVAATLSSRLGLAELRIGWPAGWVVTTGALPEPSLAADLWLRSIYPPTVLGPEPPPVHEEAEATYWAEVRRHGAARPPRD